MIQEKKLISIPGWFEFFGPLMDFLEYYYANPQFFYQDRQIDSIYDSYYNPLPLIWSGGRTPRITNLDLTMDVILEQFNNFPSIKLRHTFTNCLLDNDILINDFRCNEFVKKYIRPQDEVIINHPKLIEHFKQNYPNISLIYSTTLGITKIKRINKLTTNSIYVMNYNKNNDNEYIKQLAHKENIEILCGETCALNCPYRQQHYKEISQGILDCQTDITKLNYNCHDPSGALPKYSVQDILNREHAITNERMNELSQQGFRYFKITGRSVPLVYWLDVILYYLALPEYHEQLKSMFIYNWW